MRTLLTFSILTAAAYGFGQTPLSEGHLDLGLGYEDGEFDPHIHDHDSDVEYGTEDAYLYYGAASRATRPTNAAYGFIGAASGAPIWRNYTNNVPDIPWLGFGFEEIGAGTFGSFVQTDDRRDPISAEWIDVSLVSFTAPVGGNASFFQGQGTSPTVWFATADGIDATDKFISTAGGHEHGSFVFTTTGVYTLTFQASALDATTSARITSDEYTYTFGIEARPVPEPATVAALSLGVAAMIRRRKV